MREGMKGDEGEKNRGKGEERMAQGEGKRQAFPPCLKLEGLSLNT